MKTPNNRQSGFTLIELMIVVAIIGVLSAIAVPAYKNYVTKSELASGFATIKSTITPAELIVQAQGKLSISGGSTTAILAAIGIASGANPLGTLTTAAPVPTGENAHKGQIIFTFDEGGAAGAKFTYTRYDDGWKCNFDLGSQLPNNADAPKGCK